MAARLPWSSIGVAPPRPGWAWDIVCPALRIDTAPPRPYATASTPSAGRGYAMVSGMRVTLTTVVLLAAAGPAAAQAPEGKTVADVVVRGHRLVTAESILVHV